MSNSFPPDQRIEVLNVPNYYCTFYIKVLSLLGIIKFVSDLEYRKFDFKPILVFRWRGKLIVIDNDDPVGIIEELYDVANVYFVTNQLVNNPVYHKEKIVPLFPHYPIEIAGQYFKLFGNQVGLSTYPRLFREIFRILKRPKFVNYKYHDRSENFVFFSGSIWRKEQKANLSRAEFMEYCIKNERIIFEGGFIPRNDGQNQGYEKLLNSKTYSPRKFNQLIRKSILGFNNPAVLGAISWRFAEYLNTGVAIVSLPFKIVLPQNPKDKEEILMISDGDGVKDQLEFLLSDFQCLKQVGEGGKSYFDNYCTPEKQAEYIALKV